MFAIELCLAHALLVIFRNLLFAKCSLAVLVVSLLLSLYVETYAYAD